MKVVLDTNVLVSGILFTGPPQRILPAWSEGRFELVFTSDIHDEYRRVAAELQRQFPRVDLAAALDQVLVHAHAVPSAVLDGRVCADPDDDKFLACALASGAGTIVSGDKHTSGEQAHPGEGGTCDSNASDVDHGWCALRRTIGALSAVDLQSLP
jgi:putative PIN family toxin of toxin-antitoxin system